MLFTRGFGKQVGVPYKGEHLSKSNSKQAQIDSVNYFERM